MGFFYVNEIFWATYGEQVSLATDLYCGGGREKKEGVCLSLILIHVAGLAWEPFVRTSSGRPASCGSSIWEAS